VSYHQKKKHTCLLCRNRTRNVVYYPLMGGYYHYECWLELGRQNLREAFRAGVHIAAVVSAKPVPAPVPGQLDFFD